MRANGALILVVAHEGESEEILDKTYYVFLPPELCFVHPLPGSLVRGAQRLPSIMRRVESMLLAVQLKDIINYPVPASKVLSRTFYIVTLKLTVLQTVFFISFFKCIILIHYTVLIE